MKSYFSFQGDPLFIVCENNDTGIIARANNNIPIIKITVDFKCFIYIYFSLFPKLNTNIISPRDLWIQQNIIF